MTYTAELVVSKVYLFTVEADDIGSALEKAQAVAERRKRRPELSESIEGELRVLELPDRERWSWSIINEH